MGLFKRSNPRVFAFVCLILPLLTAVLTKLLRIDRTDMGLFDHMMLFAPEILFYGAVFLVAALLLELSASFKALVRFVAVAVVLAFSLNLLFLEIVGHYYTQSMGSSDFDYALVKHVALNLEDLFPIMEEAIDLKVFVVAGIVTSLFLAVLLGFSTNVYKLHQQDFRPFLYGAVALGAATFSATALEGYHQFPPLPDHKYRLRQAPPPISFMALRRSLKYSSSGLYTDVDPIRTSSGTGAKAALGVKTGTGSTRPNLVLIMLESTGYLATLAEKSDVNVAPYLRELASEGLSFRQTYSFIPHTSKAIESILCGVEPTFGLEIVSGKSDSALIEPCLPTLLNRQGYNSVYFSPVRSEFEFRRQFLKNVGFQKLYLMEDMDGTGYDRTGWLGYEEDMILSPVRSWLKERDNKPYLLSVLTLTPHYPYVLPASVVPRSFYADPMQNAYLNGVRYQDEFLKRLMEVFAEENALDNTIFVFIGDHGEAFGEHGLKIHNTVPYNETLLVPFVVWGEGISPGSVVDEPVSTLDVTPTLLDRLGFDFSDLKSQYAGRVVDAQYKDQPVYSYCYSPRYCAATVSGRWKFIEFFDATRGNELYDLSADPLEASNLIEQHPEVAAAMREDLKIYLSRVDRYHRDHFQQKAVWTGSR